MPAVVLFGRNFDSSFHENFRLLLTSLKSHGASISVFKPFYHFAQEWFEGIEIESLYTSSADMNREADFMLSIGGDGTFLEAVTYVGKTGIPIAGINSGRLGFLADIAQGEIVKAVDSLVNGQYYVEERTLLELCTDEGLFGELNFALNEITVHKRDDSSMITMHTKIDGEFLNSYWGDGLIVSTPTGSTAYSLSAGGPIVVPGAGDFVLSPIAPHNLTVRPLVYPDELTLSLKMEGRSGHILVSLDSRSVVAEAGIELRIQKAGFKIKTLRLKDHSFFQTLRNKLMWGIDKRN